MSQSQPHQAPSLTGRRTGAPHSVSTAAGLAAERVALESRERTRHLARVRSAARRLDGGETVSNRRAAL